MRAGAAASSTPAAAKKPDREGIIAVLQDQPTLDRIQGIVRELQLDDELTLEATLDSALRRIREGAVPRVLILDLSESAAPISRFWRWAPSTTSAYSAICSRPAHRITWSSR
jgi:hypothetical protein